MVGVLSYLISFIGILFWAFRLVVVFCASMEIDIGFTPVNLNLEIILLFLSIPCLILVLKRNLGGALAYFVLFTFYFGNDLYNRIISGGGIQTMLIDALGVALPLISLIDIAVNKNRVGVTTTNKKTSWFYANSDYDRQLDERADKNNYRT